MVVKFNKIKKKAELEEPLRWASDSLHQHGQRWAQLRASRGERVVQRYFLFKSVDDWVCADSCSAIELSSGEIKRPRVRSESGSGPIGDLPTSTSTGFPVSNTK